VQRGVAVVVVNYMNERCVCVCVCVCVCAVMVCSGRGQSVGRDVVKELY